MEEKDILNDVENEKNNGEKQEEELVLPVVALKGLPVFPHMILHFDVKREMSLNALEEAVLTGRTVFLATQKDIENDEPKKEDLNKMGTIAKIKQVLKLPDNDCRVLIEGVSRGKIKEFIPSNGCFKCKITVTEDKKDFSDEEKVTLTAYLRYVKNMLGDYYHYIGHGSADAMKTFINITDYSHFADIVCANINFEFERKQALLAETDIIKRFELLVKYLDEEIQIVKVENNIDKTVRKNLDQSQKEYYLREQLRVIQDELGDKDGIKGTVNDLRQRLIDMDVPEYVMEKADKELSRMYKMQSGSPEISVIESYVETLADLPWNISTKENKDIANAEKILNDDHYGMEQVKERILEFLAVHSLSDKLKSPIICLVGPPGVGKTSVASSVARALNRNYIRISLGGVKDESEIRGHRKTYIGAMPGRIINALIQAGSNNPLILLDEVDKMSSDFKGDPSSALLEVLDGEQNNSFRDHYVELPFDLSNVMFITTANSVDTIDRPLLDRMEIIEVSGYTDNDKLHIAKEHLLSKILKANGLKKGSVKFSDDAILEIINSYTRESGVRNLERKMSSVVRKIAKKIASKEIKSKTITKKNLEEFLSKKTYPKSDMYEKSTVGVVTGLAWTQYGGDTLFVEVNISSGSGKTEITGRIGDVMKESALAAISYIRSSAKELGVNENFYKHNDIHIHVPEGATPKDGPSAGITMATGLVSALTNKKVRNDVAMTGEITIRGRVLPIGGLKEKSLAAYRAGIRTIIIPFENERDIDDIPEEIRDKIKFIPVKSMEQVLDNALIKTKE